ncbi:hypothetical protein [Stackebrandtia soli]|uniref:tetratricopeptide repeat protein n=1 Tax=Stackebrandtia soli TaxID=1892856 RepID=UPI0039E92C84
MSSASPARLLTAIRSRRYWRGVGKVCDVALTVVNDSPSWNARAGYAAARAGNVELALAHYEAAIFVTEADTPALWWHRVGRLYAQRGDTELALDAQRMACLGDPGNIPWWRQLERAAVTADVPAVYAEANEALIRLGEGSPSRYRKLASALERIGRWSHAQQLLIGYLHGHGSDIDAWRQLGELCLNLRRYGGSFDVDTSTFVPDELGKYDHAAIAVEAFTTALAARPGRAGLRMKLADALTAAGRHAEALERYESAVATVESASGRWALSAKHIWQFRLEAAYARGDEHRVADPLLHCVISEALGESVVGAPGVFGARFVFDGLTIEGFVVDPDVESVDILLGGAVLRRVNVLREGAGLGKFLFKLRRQTVAMLPREATISVTGNGKALSQRIGGATIELTIPHGDARLPGVLAGGGTVDKKGVISPSFDETIARQERYLRIYREVSTFFEQTLGRPLFLVYGTLLGYVREGDFIEGDDDFDCGYLADASDPEGVKADARAVITALIKAGFTVSFNRLGRLFRVQLEREDTDAFHLDVHPIWFEGPDLLMHNTTSFPSDLSRFQPVEFGKLRGERVAVPADAEHWLESAYGPDWRTPDPGFIYYREDVDPVVERKLTAALMTAAEAREFEAEIKAETDGVVSAGRLVSIGSNDLYPLGEYLA